MHARRTDTTHAEIRDGLRAAGFLVMDVRGDIDLIAMRHGIILLIECKTKGNVRPNSATGRKQADIAADWGDSVITAICLEDVLWAFQMRLKRAGWTK